MLRDSEEERGLASTKQEVDVEITSKACSQEGQVVEPCVHESQCAGM